MYCVNCGAEVSGSFCAKCGAIIEEQAQGNRETNNTAENTFSDNRNKNKKANPVILARSVNCTQRANEAKKAFDKRNYSMFTVAAVVGLLVLFLPYLIAVLQGKELAEAEPFPLFIVIPVVLAALFMFICVIILAEKSAKDFTTFNTYCSSEVLVADEHKIYGSTLMEEFELKYDQIKDVSFSINSCPFPFMKEPFGTNDVFVVRDVAGNVYVFYSFTNCNELKTLIDMQMREFQNNIA